MIETASVSIAQLRLEPAAKWFGERLCRLLNEPAPGAQHAVSWCLHQWMQGHTCLDFTMPLQARTLEEDSIEEREASVPQEWLDALRHTPGVEQADLGSLSPASSPLVLEGSRLFLSRCRSHEISVAQELARRAAQPSLWCERGEVLASLLKCINHACEKLHALQAQAVRVACTRRLSVITGGPGTGKTTVASRVIEAVLECSSQPLLLLAPTGKAAARLQQSIREASLRADFSAGSRAVLASLQAQTVHAATMREQGEAVRRARLVIIDETSMIDLERMHEVLRLAHPDASIVLLGDPHQLTSVEAGSVLGDIVPSEGDTTHPLAACTVRLQVSHRFPAQSGIGKLAAAVNAGDESTAMQLLQSASDQLRWVKATSAAAVVAQAIAARDAYGDQAIILCGHRRGHDGAVQVNQSIVRTKQGSLAASAANRHFIGRPILVTVNDDNTGLRNGDAGVMHLVEEAWLAKFTDRENAVPAELLPPHETAYALTIHKTQGSEYDQVVVALPFRASPVLTRELLYTGITRTRGPVTIISSEASLRAAIGRPIYRSSGLRERLVAAAKVAAAPA